MSDEARDRLLEAAEDLYVAASACIAHLQGKVLGNLLTAQLAYWKAKRARDGLESWVPLEELASEVKG